MLRKQLYLTLIVMALLGCSGNKKNSSADISADSLSVPSNSNDTETAASPAATIKLVVTGGEMAGTYETVCKSTCCSHGIAGKDVFGVQYSEDGKAANELSSVQLLVSDVTASKSTTEFLVTVAFGELSGKKGKSYTINTQNEFKGSAYGSQQGSGKLDIEFSNDKSTVKLKGKTADNVQLDLTLNCK